jgi:hypothetical protein
MIANAKTERVKYREAAFVDRTQRLSTAAAISGKQSVKLKALRVNSRTRSLSRRATTRKALWLIS